jgi:hypothetical protein
MEPKNSHDELSAEQKEFVRNVVRDLALFASHMLGINLWE